LIATADGCGAIEVMRRSGLSKPAVWRWQERFPELERGSVRADGWFASKGALKYGS